MQARLMKTNEMYHEMIAAEDDETRTALYLAHFVKPWERMMAMFAQGYGNGATDALAGARAWHWLLPDDLREMPSQLAALEAADAWRMGAEALEKAAAAFDPYTARIGFDQVTGWLMLASPAMGTGDRGYTGATDWTQPQFVGQFSEVTPANVRRLPGLLAHEMHHLIRFRATPWNMMTASVADYMVLEGLAESFATALFGEAVLGFYVTDVDGAALETARGLTGGALHETGFNVTRGYIFGDALAGQFGAQVVGGMPAYGGYAVGYHTVQAFLERTGTSIVEATFMAADEIVAGSGMFG